MDVVLCSSGVSFSPIPPSLLARLRCSCGEGVRSFADTGWALWILPLLPFRLGYVFAILHFAYILTVLTWYLVGSPESRWRWRFVGY